MLAQPEAEAPEGWAVYRDVFLSAEVQGLIRSRLEGAEPSSDGARNPKKRKIEGIAAPAGGAQEDAVAVVCEHCGGRGLAPRGLHGRLLAGGDGGAAGAGA